MATKKKSAAKRAAGPARTTTAMAGRPGFTAPPVSAMIYSLGDSWFTYPTIFDQGAPINLIRALDSARQPGGAKYFFNEHGHPGATSGELTTGAYLDGLTRSISADNYDFLLLSMGGNDFVGSQTVDGVTRTSFGLYLRNFNGQTRAEDLLDPAIVTANLDTTLGNYRRIFELCEQQSRNGKIQIVTHVYDYPIPTNRGANVLGRWHVLGPWMYNDLLDKGIPKKFWNDVGAALLRQFRTRLTALADELNANTAGNVRLLVADTQGTLPAGDSDYWINEIHPKNIGYKLLVKKLQAAIDPIRDALPRAAWRTWPR